MMIKIVLLMLVVLAVLAMFGRLRFGGPGTTRQALPRRCPSCDRPLVGKGPCSCGNGAAR